LSSRFLRGRQWVVEKCNSFSGEVLLSFQCSVWMVSTMEKLMGSPGVPALAKSFREGSKLSIVRLGRNDKGRFVEVEVAVYGVGGQRGFLLIPEGRGGWGWIKFVGELSKAKALSLRLGAVLALPHRWRRKVGRS